MLDIWSLGMLGGFGILTALVYRAALSMSTRDSRREQCLSRLLTDQLGTDRR
jgi:hypothetical protein